MLTELLSEIDAHLAWRADQNRPLAESTFGLLAVNDGKLVGRLRGGSDITVGKMDAIRRWIATDRTEAPAHAAQPGAAA